MGIAKQNQRRLRFTKMSYSKMMMHTAKYPHCEVDRLLLGTFFKIRLPESYF